jgi:hypothetical protein
LHILPKCQTPNSPNQNLYHYLVSIAQSQHLVQKSHQAPKYHQKLCT